MKPARDLRGCDSELREPHLEDAAEAQDDEAKGEGEQAIMHHVAADLHDIRRRRRGYRPHRHATSELESRATYLVQCNQEHGPDRDEAAKPIGFDAIAQVVEPLDEIELVRG